MKCRLVSAIFTAFSALAQSASPGADPSAALFGRVVDTVTHQPVRRAFVKIYRGGQQWDEITGADGGFRSPPIARNEYQLIVHRGGYTDRSYLVERADFDAPKQLRIELYPQAVITGRIVDRAGQPLQGAYAEALPPPSPEGTTTVAGSVQTNDLGEYRLFGLDPNTYRIRATYREGGHEDGPLPVAMATALYGESGRPVELSVKSGSVTTGIDFVLSPAPPASVRGSVRTPDGRALDRVILWCSGQAGEGGRNGQSKDGVFQIRDVGPGSYLLSAETLPDAPTPLYGRVAIAVQGADVNGVEIVMRPSPKIEGRLRLERGDIAGHKLPAIYFLRTDHSDSLPMRIGAPDSSGAFQVVLPPGEYWLALGTLPGEWGLQSITLGDKAITDSKLSIESSPQPIQLVVTLRRTPRP